MPDVDSGCDRLADGVEITPEMIEAGLIELYGFSPENDLAEEAVEKIFRAMIRVGPQSPKA
jgi:hypothetical protein